LLHRGEGWEGSEGERERGRERGREREREGERESIELTDLETEQRS
jgi:hypothetical protein